MNERERERERERCENASMESGIGPLRLYR